LTFGISEGIGLRLDVLDRAERRRRPGSMMLSWLSATYFDVEWRLSSGRLARWGCGPWAGGNNVSAPPCSLRGCENSNPLSFVFVISRVLPAGMHSRSRVGLGLRAAGRSFHGGDGGWLNRSPKCIIRLRPLDRSGRVRPASDRLLSRSCGSSRRLPWHATGVRLDGFRRVAVLRRRVEPVSIRAATLPDRPVRWGW
jgi:hypothetical protein